MDIHVHEIADARSPLNSNDVLMEWCRSLHDLHEPRPYVSTKTITILAQMIPSISSSFIYKHKHVSRIH